MITNLNLSEGAKRKIKETESKKLELTVFNGKIDLERILDKDNRVLFINTNSQINGGVTEYLRSETNPDYVVEIENGIEFSRRDSYEKDGKKIITEEWISEEETSGIKMKSITTVDKATNLVESFKRYDKLSGTLLFKSRSEYDDKKRIVKIEENDCVDEIDKVLTFEYEEKDNGELCTKTYLNGELIEESIVDRFQQLLYDKTKCGDTFCIFENTYKYYTDKEDGKEKSIQLKTKSVSIDKHGKETIDYTIDRMYDKNNNIIKCINKTGNKKLSVTQWQYDRKGRLVSQVVTNNKKIISNLINSYIGDIKKSVERFDNLNTVESEYDSNGALIKSTYNKPDGETIISFYNSRIKSVIYADKNGKETNRDEYERITIEL